MINRVSLVPFSSRSKQNPIETIVQDTNRQKALYINEWKKESSKLWKEKSGNKGKVLLLTEVE